MIFSKDLLTDGKVFAIGRQSLVSYTVILMYGTQGNIISN